MRVPVLFGRPIFAYSAPPIAMMCFTWQSVSTLFTIVGRHVEAEHRREIRRLDPRIGALAFERFDQAGFFAADVGAGAAMNVNLDIESGAENIFAEEIFGARFFDCALEDFRAFREFASYIDVGGVRVERETGDEHALEQLMRIFDG